MFLFGDIEQMGVSGEFVYLKYIESWRFKCIKYPKLALCWNYPGMDKTLGQLDNLGIIYSPNYKNGISQFKSIFGNSDEVSLKHSHIENLQLLSERVVTHLLNSPFKAVSCPSSFIKDSISSDVILSDNGISLLKINSFGVWGSMLALHFNDVGEVFLLGGDISGSVSSFKANIGNLKGVPVIVVSFVVGDKAYSYVFEKLGINITKSCDYGHEVFYAYLFNRVDLI